MDVKEENYRKRMNLGQDGNSLVQLLVLNAVLFVVLKFVFVFFLLTNSSTDGFFTHVFNWFILPANPENLAWRPWTIISFMFTDHQLLRFISNMFWLWSFGYILQDLTGNRKLITYLPVWGTGGSSSVYPKPFDFPQFAELINTDSLFRCQLFNCRSCHCNYRGFAGLSHFPNDQRGHSFMDTDPDFFTFEFFRN